jgi:general secretion pathway protein I
MPFAFTRRRTAGFTLLEVLIALAILAVALAASVRAAGGAINTALTLKQRTLAQWVAENRLAEETAQQNWPDAGTKNGDAAQAGQVFTWEEIVSETPNPQFRKVEFRIFAAGDDKHVLVSLIGYLTKFAATPSAPVGAPSGQSDASGQSGSTPATPEQTGTQNQPATGSESKNQNETQQNQ